MGSSSSSNYLVEAVAITANRFPLNRAERRATRSRSRGILFHHPISSHPELVSEKGEAFSSTTSFVSLGHRSRICDSEATRQLKEAPSMRSKPWGRRVNLYFQSVMHHGHTWKSASMDLKKELEASQQKCKEWDGKYYVASNDLKQMRAENLFICHEMEKGKTGVIEEFLDSEDFQDILDEHEDNAYDGIFQTAWEKATDTVSDKF
ncbi:hypothetical protein POM88_020136 [Heracleum sosnowskyi]|uniref:Uncharacterized protein n=1 Tax=Heracleum sosnowskyi TaxID=360622 RepID=A0AAD8IBB3_9APIA|nr:hypothetical protein POM88_020136 [Heracleum sosnowskyi]